MIKFTILDIYIRRTSNVSSIP